MRRLHLIIHGEVQGVFFRDYVKKAAHFLKLKGWVKNNDDGTVEVVAEGTNDLLQEFLSKCKRGPVLAKVTKVDIMWEEATKEFDFFEVRR
ncbi:MAG: acylphosphatase [Candidatus Woesearchaeota archaeon]